MMHGFTHSPLRGPALARAVEALLLLGILVGGSWGYRFVRAAHLTVLAEEAAHSAEPNYLVGVSQLQTELRGREHDLARIRQLVVSPEDVVSFITNIEQAAQRLGIALKVSSIEEVQQRNELGEVVAETGPFRSIRLNLTGRGTGEQLLEYVHQLEHGTHLVVVREWTVAHDPTAAVATSQAEGARAVDPVAAGSNAAASVAPAQLTAEVVVLVHNEAYAF